MSKFQPAGVSEILRSAQRDDHHTKYLQNLIIEIVQRTLGIPFWLKWKEIFDSISCLLYYSLTTLSGYQTLGEEYVYVIQVDSSLRKLPSFQRRLVYVALQSLGPVFLLYFQRSVVKKIEKLSSYENQLSGKRTALASFLKTASILFGIFSFIQRLHLVLFYFNGAFYHISKRITGIQYVMLRRWLLQVNSQKSWRLLGYVTACQLFISLFLDISSYYKTVHNAESKKCEPNVSGTVTVKNQCSLCLEKSKDATLTPCGHIFCWYCIMNWLQNKEECPLCREQFGASRLVFLQNYT